VSLRESMQERDHSETRDERTVAAICAGNVAKGGEYRRDRLDSIPDDRTPRISRAQRRFADGFFHVHPLNFRDDFTSPPLSFTCKR